MAQNTSQIDRIIEARTARTVPHELYTIGEFALVGNVSVKSLRYYEKIGLLSPIAVNGETGYRYYHLDQLPRLNRIFALKNLGLSLGEIGHLLEENLSPLELRGMLRLKQAELQDRILEEQRRLAEVEARLQMIETGRQLPRFEVAIKTVRSHQVMTAPKIHPQSVANYSPIFQKLARTLDRHGLKRGLAVGIYHPREWDGQWMAAADSKAFFGQNEPWFYQAGYIIEGECPTQLETGDGIILTSLELPMTPTVASITYHGALGTRRGIYLDFIEWVGINDYRIGLPSYEI
jgi:DNA-binding transcriptional MerR regulator